MQCHGSSFYAIKIAVMPQNVASHSGGIGVVLDACTCHTARSIKTSTYIPMVKLGEAMFCPYLPKLHNDAHNM